MNTQTNTAPPTTGGDTATTADAMLDMAGFAMAFGAIQRATLLPDGTTREDDATHTVMLGMIACSLAARFHPGLDVGKVAQYALVHDAQERYAGDVDTLTATPDERAAKAADEAAATDRIDREFGDTLPWLPSTIRAYETMADAEARFVKAVDKLLPLLTEVLSGMAGTRARGVGAAALAAHYDRQVDEIALYASDFPVVFEVRQRLVAETLRILASA